MADLYNCPKMSQDGIMDWLHANPDIVMRQYHITHIENLKQWVITYDVVTGSVPNYGREIKWLDSEQTRADAIDRVLIELGV